MFAGVRPFADVTHRGSVSGVTGEDADRPPDDRPGAGARHRLGLVRRAFVTVMESAASDFRLLLGLDLIASVAGGATLLVAGKVLSILTGDDPTWAEMWPWLLLVSVLTVVVAVMNAVQAERTQMVATILARHVSRRLLAVAGAVEYEAFEDPTFHDRLRRARANIDDRTWTLVWAVARALRTLLDIVMVSVVLLVSVPLLLPVGIIAFIPLWLASVRNSRALYELEFSLTEDDRRREYLERSLTTRQAAKEVRAFALAAPFRERHATLYDDRVDRVRAMVNRRTVRRSVGSVVTAVFMASALVGVIWLTSRGTISVAAAAVAVVAFRQLGNSVRALDGAAATLHEESQFLSDFEAFEAMVPEIESHEAGRPLPSTFTGLRVEGVSFRYPGTHAVVLHDIDLAFPPTQTVAVVGPNGSGKTTFSLLLAGLFAPTEGRLTWSGADLADVVPSQRRAAVSSVFQDFVRYELSVRENVALGAPQRVDDLEAIRAATAAVGLDAHVMSLERGYDTILSREYEGGAELSVGQWQRLAIARAFFRDLPVVLMDEPSSALDAVAEQDLFERIRAVGEGRLLIYISHRFSTVRNADRIIVLDEGRIVGDGDHGELMASCGLYRRMYDAQADVFLGQPSADN